MIPGSHLWGLDKHPTPEQTVAAEMDPGSALFWLGRCSFPLVLPFLAQLVSISAGSTYHGAGENSCSPNDADSVRILYGVFATKDFLRTEEAIHLSTPLHVAKSLDREVLRRAGFAKGAGGTGNLSTAHPMDRWDEIVR